MARKCAFCPSTAKISGEHIWSEWMAKLFPPARVTFEKIAQDGSFDRRWQNPSLDMTAKVVCKKCNETWMSGIESNHAQPAMSDLILGKHISEITEERAHSISLFAFKTAVITNQMASEDECFFDISERYAFRESLSIPADVGMWLLGFEPVNAGGFRSWNVYFPNKDIPHLTLNVCSFYVGQLGFQVVSGKSTGSGQIESLPMFTDLTIPFYPAPIKSGISWPRNTVLGVKAFYDFAARWNRVKFN